MTSREPGARYVRRRRRTMGDAYGGLNRHPSIAGDRYLLLADISGYTAFTASVERAHGVDFSAGIPAGYAVLGELLDAVVEGFSRTSRWQCASVVTNVTGRLAADSYLPAVRRSLRPRMHNR